MPSSGWLMVNFDMGLSSGLDLALQEFEYIIVVLFNAYIDFSIPKYSECRGKLLSDSCAIHLSLWGTSFLLQYFIGDVLLDQRNLYYHCHIGWQWDEMTASMGIE